MNNLDIIVLKLKNDRDFSLLYFNICIYIDIHIFEIILNYCNVHRLEFKCQFKIYNALKQAFLYEGKKISEKCHKD